jgi:hypothetical protein
MGTEKEVVMRDIGMKVLKRIDMFKQIDNVIIQYSPGHASLPWAAFRFLLMVEHLTLVTKKYNI